MKLKGLVDEDFVNYKQPSMFFITSFCDFKCDKEFGTTICQNLPVIKQKTIEVDNATIIDRYLNNPITKAIVFGGLEPFDTFKDMFDFIKEFRRQSNDTIVIYTGFNEDEIKDKIEALKQFKNIIVKFGRFIPNQKTRFDEVLGIELASDNQFAMYIS